MGIISSGQITITDLSDAPVLSAFITASQTTTQVFDQTANTYNPSYASTPQKLTLNLTKAGQTSSILGQVGKISWYEYNGSTKTAITSTTNTDNQYLSGTHNEVLTTKVNVPASAGAKRYEAVGTWTDPVTGLKVDFRASIDSLAVQLGKQSLVLNVYTGKGNTFYNNQPASLTVNADLYKGNALSGGNKQKVVLARWVGKDSDLIILDSPTRGIDVKVKADIYAMMNDMRKRGKSIIMISEEIMELLGMADRILIMKDGKINGEFLRSPDLKDTDLIDNMI